MLETSARLLRLLSLFQAQRYWSGADLAERLEVTGRTLRRDVDRLRSLGYPVNSTSGAAGGYQLGSGATLPPLQLDDDEAVAVALGLRTAASGSVAGIEESSVRALAKLEQVLPERLRRRVAALHAFICAAGRRRSDGGLRQRFRPSPARAATPSSCGSATRAATARASRREVEPHRLVHTGRRWYLVAWDLDRDDWRTFRVDRIEPRLTTGTRFTPREPPDGDFAAYASRSVAYAPYPYRARVKLHASVRMVAERIPASVGMLEAVDDQTCLLHTGGFSLDSLSVWMALIGFDFEVQDPPELAERIRLLADRFRRAAEPKVSAP